AALRAAARALARLLPTGADAPAPPADLAEAIAMLERAEEALAEAETLLSRLAEAAQPDARALERTEERLFALRAASRKHGVPVAGLAALHAELAARLAALETGSSGLAALAAECAAGRAAYLAAAAELSEARRAAAQRLERAIGRELPPLRLDKARFSVALTALGEDEWGPGGAESVRFLIATNPGQPPGPLAKVASGGELSRLMLALKVVLASAAPVPSLVFDEVDSGIGGATAASVGERLARVAATLQVLVVTHSPQVAARGARHFVVAKDVRGARAATRVDALEGPARQEEIARMLSGAEVTEAARAAAAALLAGPRAAPPA
ncbi:MAG: DNA repair protein RecN, partial [Rhodospirillales bacterium]|nr:DNA repair protein RecN [Rhodospirillales bacterium]